MEKLEAEQTNLQKALKKEIGENEILKAMMEAVGVGKDVIAEALSQVLSG